MNQARIEETRCEVVALSGELLRITRALDVELRTLAAETRQANQTQRNAPRVG